MRSAVCEVQRMRSVENEEFEKNIRKICLFAMFFKRDSPLQKIASQQQLYPRCVVLVLILLIFYVTPRKTEKAL